MIKSLKKVLSLLFFLSLITSCKDKMTYSELQVYISNPENGLSRKKELAGLNYTLSYLPEKLLTKYKDPLTRKNNSFNYFILRIAFPDSKKSTLKKTSIDNADYLNKLYYVQTKIQKDFNLIVSGKKNPCVFLHHEEDHSILNDFKLIIAFDAPPENEDITIEYEDNLFGQGLINFKFKKEDLTTIPDLKI